ncbi:nuclear transport factor 2 family protein [Propionivibrio sp.]|uniref:nuclear transport factor 2 family protein n=1 Tax=Propionivibrio sp. TaxID=2212460 RepID=UPI0039E55BCF
MLKRFFFAVTLCSLLGLAPAAFAKDEGAAVAKAAEQLRVLMVEPDKAKLEALVAKELSYGHSGGKIDTKASFIDDLLTGVSDFLSIDIADQSVVVVGDTALIRHTLTGDTHDKGKDPGKVNLKILQVWKKVGGQWKLLARQAVRAPQ